MGIIKIIKIEVQITRYRPLSNVKRLPKDDLNITDNDRGGSSVDGAVFDIGDYLRNKKAIIVPQNKNDPMCFLWANTVGKFRPEKDSGRITKLLRKQSKTFNIEGINFPPGKGDIIRFEKLNGIKIHCLCAMKNSERIDHYKAARDPDWILILIKNPGGESHGCYIPSLSWLSRLVSSSISKSKRVRFICTNCHVKTFRTQGALKTHQELCFKNEAQLLSVPRKGEVIKFRNYKNTIKCPIKIADFECYQPMFGEKHGKTSEYTAIIHKPSGYGFCVVSEYEDVFKTSYESNTFDGDVAKDLVKRLIEVRDEIDKIPSKEMIFTEEDKRNYDNDTHC